MIETLALVLGGPAVVMVAHAIADRTGLPAPVPLVVVGIGYDYLPLPGANLELDPEIVLFRHRGRRGTPGGAGRAARRTGRCQVPRSPDRAEHPSAAGHRQWISSGS